VVSATGTPTVAQPASAMTAPMMSALNEFILPPSVGY
jgi:hypothetical protein